MIPFFRSALAILGWVCLAGLPRALANDEAASSPSGQAFPPGLSIDMEGTLSQTRDGAVFEGPVTLVWRESRIQADHLSLRDRRYIEARGNVLIVWGGNRVYGTRMTYDLETERGVLEQAMGQVLDEYTFWADSIEKVGEDTLHLRHATVTTCTQPLPYWSFAVSSATIHIDHYARMWNVRLRAGRAPLIYLPFLAWPVKEGRAAGLLMPEFHTTTGRGQAITQQLFVPLGRSADVTLTGRYYSEVGLGGGGELRFMPNREGTAMLSGFYIVDSVGPFAGVGRYRADYRQTQQFLNGFRMVADIQLVSDSQYFSDFERELNIVSLPQTLARIEFSRNGPWVSLNVRELRREQLSSECGLNPDSCEYQQTLPEIEWRGRSRRLGQSPLYVSFESSVASIQQHQEQPVPLDSEYLRGDVYPTLTLPWSPVAWLDITPRVSYRLTHYTQRLQSGQVEDRALTRALRSYGFDATGPKLFRIYGRSEAKARYKHSIEPQVRFGYDESYETGRILAFDDVDGASGSGTQAQYRIVQRLFGRRPRSEPEPPPAIGDLPSADDASAAPEAAPSPAEPPPPPVQEPVELASFEIEQRRSFDRDLSFARRIEGEESSPYSDIGVRGRFRPSDAASIDVRSSYHILFHAVSEVSVSGEVRNRLSDLRFSWIRQNGLGVNQSLTPIEDSTQARLTADLRLWSDKLQFRVDGSYNAHPEEDSSHFPDQRWQVQYSTQCCTFLIERLTRDFSKTEDRRELFFRLDLRGVGKLLTKTF